MRVHAWSAVTGLDLQTVAETLDLGVTAAIEIVSAANAVQEAIGDVSFLQEQLVATRKEIDEIEALLSGGSP